MVPVGLPWEEPWGCVWLASVGLSLLSLKDLLVSKALPHLLSDPVAELQATSCLLGTEVSSLHQVALRCRGRARDRRRLCLALFLSGYVGELLHFFAPPFPSRGTGTKPYV